MKNKKSAGFKMKKSPNKFFDAVAASQKKIGSQAKIDPSYYMAGGLGEGQPIPSDTGGPSRPNPYGRPIGLFGGGKPNSNKTFFGRALGGSGGGIGRPNLYGRPRRGNFMANIFDRLRDQMPKGLFGGGKPNTPRHVMAALGGADQMPTRRPDTPNPRVRGGGGERKPTGWSIEGKPTYGPAFPGMRTMSAMAKKSGFTMKKSSKPNKPEFFKGKK